MYNILLTLILNFFLKLQIDIWYFFACRKVFAMNHKLQNSVFIQKKKNINPSRNMLADGGCNNFPISLLLFNIV